MAKPNLGDKQICPNCETRFFDLGKTPPTCPKCSTVLEGQKGKAKAKAVVEPEPVEEEAAPSVEDDLDIDIDLDVDDALDDDDEDDDLMEDASDLGGDDDMSGVIDHTDSKGDDG